MASPRTKRLLPTNRSTRLMPCLTRPGKRRPISAKLTRATLSAAMAKAAKVLLWLARKFWHRLCTHAVASVRSMAVPSGASGTDLLAQTLYRESLGREPSVFHTKQSGDESAVGAEPVVPASGAAAEPDVAR